MSKKIVKYIIYDINKNAYNIWSKLDKKYGI